MYREFVTNKWVVSGIAFLILFSLSCFLWYQYETAPYKQDATETTELTRGWETEKLKTTDAAEKVSPQHLSPTPDRTGETPESSMQKQGTTRSKPSTDMKVPTPSVKNAKPIQMSPHGFGPYPTIPDNAPIAEFEESDGVNMELLGRVMVKAWNQGERFTGGTIDGGKVYLNYSDVIYIEWAEAIDEETGETVFSVESMMAGFYMSDELRESIKAGNIPPGYTLLNYDEAGINSYEYLGLP